jgi:hypothetical protein
MDDLKQRFKILNIIKCEIKEKFQVNTFIHKTMFTNKWVLATKDSKSYHNDELINYVESRSKELAKTIIIPIIWIKNN